MLKSAAQFTRKRALTIVLIISVIIFVLILIKWVAAYRNNSGLMTIDGRESLLFSLGWKIDRSSEEKKDITLPEKFEGVMADYNALQLTQGYDMEKYAGKECVQYTYRITNYESKKQDVYATIYICGRELIGGDIHTLSSDGFMHGIIRTPKA